MDSKSVMNDSKDSKMNDSGDQGSFRGRGGRGFNNGGSRGGGNRGSFRGGRGGGGERSMDGGFEGGRGGAGFRGRGDRGGGNRGERFPGKYPHQDRIGDKLKQIAGPQVDLPPRDETIRKFSNHCRLWIGNLPLDISEDDVRELFKPYGEFDEVYFDKNKGFAFVRMDYKSNAEKARQELHLKEYKNRQLKIRFSSPGTSLKVRNISPWVTNELLHKSFEVFGELERAVVITDERGRSTGEGILEYCKKPCAQLALKKASDGCFFLTCSPRPVIVEAMAALDDNEGMSELNINKRNPEYMKERQSGPRFAAVGSFEFEYGLKWKQLYELFDKKKEMLEKELNDEKSKLEEQIEYAKYQHETEMLREQLLHREENSHTQQAEYEQRQQHWEDHRRLEEERQALIEEELSVKYRAQEEELRRRQEENRQFMQDRLMKDDGMDDMGGYGDHMGGGSRWGRNDGYSGGGSSWRGADQWGTSRGGGGARGAGQHWDRSGFQRGEDLAPAAPRGRGRGGRGRGRGGRGGFSQAEEEEEEVPVQAGNRRTFDSESSSRGGNPNKRARF